LNTVPPIDARTNACVYILHMLLQRLETKQPGLVQDMLNGAKADQAACSTNESRPANVDPTFEEAISILEMIHSQNEMVSGMQID